MTPGNETSKRIAFGTFERWLFAFLLVLFLIPIWMFQYFPSQDGPAHIYNSKLLLQYFLNEIESFQEYYRLNTRPDPTWFGHALMAGFMYFFPPLIVEKIFLSIYVVFFPLSVRFALISIRPGSQFLSILSFPFIYNLTLHMGFYSFSASLAVMFLLIGVFSSKRGILQTKDIIILGFLSLLLFLCHIVTLVIAYAFISAYILILGLQDAFAKPKSLANALHDFSSSLISHSIKPLMAFTPTIILVVIFLLPRNTSYHPGPSIPDRLFGLIHLDSLSSFYTRRELWLSSAFALLFFILSLHFIITKIESREVNRNDAFFAAFLVVSLIYFVTPEPHLITASGLKGEGVLHMRLNLFPFFALILWLGAQHYEPAMKKVITVIALSVSLGLLFMHMQKHRVLNEQLNEYVSASEYLAPNSTVLSLAIDHGGVASDGKKLSQKTAPFVHAINYLGIDKNIISLNNYEASMGYFPIIFQESRHPYLYIGNLESAKGNPPDVDILNYSKITGGSVDYVLVWLGQKRRQGHPYLESIYNQLEKDYKLIYTSENQLLQLFHRINDNADDAESHVAPEIFGPKAVVLG